MDQTWRTPLKPAAFRVERLKPETTDTFTLWLAPADKAAPFRFAPGQFNMLYAFGVGEVPISVSGDPDGPGGLVHTIRDVGPVTRALRKLRRERSSAFGGRSERAGRSRRRQAMIS